MLDDERNEVQMSVALRQMQISEIKNKLEVSSRKRMAIQKEVGDISTSFKATHMTGPEYRSLANKRNGLIGKLAEIDSVRAPLKIKLRELSAANALDIARLHEKASWERSAPFELNANLVRRLEGLRSEWLNFAEDQTRVNSMRILAAQFSNQLTTILGELNG